MKTASAEHPLIDSMFGYRMRVDMSALFEDERASGALWMHPARARRPVADLERAIVEGWGLRRPVRLVVGDMLLPRQEPAAIVRPGDVIKVLPEPTNWMTRTDTVLNDQDDVDGGNTTCTHTADGQTHTEKRRDAALSLTEQRNHTITDAVTEQCHEPVIPHLALNDASNDQHEINKLNGMQWSPSQRGDAVNDPSVTVRKRHIVFDDDGCSVDAGARADTHYDSLLPTSQSATKLHTPIDGYSDNTDNETSSLTTLEEAKRRALQLLAGGGAVARARRRRVRRRPKATSHSPHSHPDHSLTGTVALPSLLSETTTNTAFSVPAAHPMPAAATVPAAASSPVNGDAMHFGRPVRAASESRAPRLVHAI